jgi:predicted dienelactone hydrolase
MLIFLCNACCLGLKLNTLLTTEEVVPFPTNWTCPGVQNLTIVHPTDTSKKYPLLSFAHGYGAGGALLSVYYKGLLSFLASHGYVVVATEDATSSLCFSENVDQIASMQFMKDKNDPRVDWNAPTGVVGHSMGGYATLLSAQDTDNIKKFNIRASVALHPMGRASSNPPAPPPTIATMFTTGSKDKIVPSSSTFKYYNETFLPGTVYANLKGADHLEPMTADLNRLGP